MIRVVCERTCMFTRTINLSVKNTIVKNRPADSPSFIRNVHHFFCKDISHLSICTLGSCILSGDEKAKLQITHKRVYQKKPYPHVNLD